MSKETKVSISIRLSAEVFGVLTQWHVESGKSRSRIVSDAITQHLPRRGSQLIASPSNGRHSTVLCTREVARALDGCCESLFVSRVVLVNSALIAYLVANGAPGAIEL